MTDADDFTSDCANCAALCCLALAFDADASFAHDKPAGVACHNLAATEVGLGCAIHKDLTQKGYSGCVAYQCLGAGQRTTALFDTTWRDDPKLTVPMMDAFRQMRSVQKCRQLLLASQALSLPRDLEMQRDSWLDRITPDIWSLAALEQFELDNTETEVTMWLRGLANYVPQTT
ncbi:hypothetical protein EDD53_1787 [Pacificibacter maritimus]|uniref:Pentapeptide repeat protein n=1 Tax=Pacificibacter maritimus TaxID=762213 RepID=A0A3N4V0L2_9RHOB|nr:hypothetical protein [Pacificibacter maritimus]RPE67380.1 hypothetical protein EDD53_1787 [Pacificibacter maritimus]